MTTHVARRAPITDTGLVEPCGVTHNVNFDALPDVGDRIDLYGRAEYVVVDRKYMLPLNDSRRIWLRLGYAPTETL